MAAENAYKYDYGYAQTAEPLIREEQQQKAQLKTLKKQKPDAITLEKRDLKQVLKIAAAVALVIAMFGIVCDSHYKKESAKRNLNAANSNLIICQSELKELNSKLIALRTEKNIDLYAVEKLGMVKVTSDNEVYLDSFSSNQVILSQSTQEDTDK